MLCNVIVVVVDQQYTNYHTYILGFGTLVQLYIKHDCKCQGVCIDPSFTLPYSAVVHLTNKRSGKSLH